MSSGRVPLLVAPELRGREYAEAHSKETDRWFRSIADDALDSLDGVALIAVGGYGRGGLSPYSDIDVVLVHADDVDGARVAEALWYPVWDRGLKMGYVVVTIDQARRLLDDEFEWATAFLDTRLVTGDPELHAAVDELTATAWRDRCDELMRHLAGTVESRHRDRGDAAFQIEPNLKEGRGGLRDVHALGWANRATPGFADDDLADLSQEVDILLDARVELHRLANRPNDVLTLDEQDGVAAALGDSDGQQLMFRLSTAARRIAWHSDEAWSRWERSLRYLPANGRDSDEHTIDSAAVADTTPFVAERGILTIRPEVDVAADPLLTLRLAVLAAESELVMDRASLAALEEHAPAIDVPWPAEARRLFAALFLTGRPAIGVVEDLHRFGLMVRLLPEWERVASKPQRNVLHTFTVDRHLCEAAVNASALVDRVVRPDLLVVGALFHDIGKGYPGDHTEVGMEVIATIGERMGYPPSDLGVLVDLCRHHLLLPDFATRRDLSDPGTIKAVAAAVDSVEFLALLAALTEADSIATGPSAWSTWKAGLLHDLVARTTEVLEGASPDEVTGVEFPTREVAAMMAQRRSVLEGNGTTLTVVVPERLGLFSTMAGVLAVNGLDVLDAAAYSEDRTRRVSMAACQFVLQPPQTGEVDWDRVISTAQRALDGRLALRERIARRAREHARYRRRLSAEPPRLDVVIDNDISELSTVVEVHAPDDVGLLYRLTQVLRELLLDIRSAKVQTFGPQAVDSFYLQDSGGRKITDRQVVAELKLALGETIGLDG